MIDNFIASSETKWL